MSRADLGKHVLAAVLMVFALYLMWHVNWRVAAGVFLFVWGNNIVYSTRLKATIQKGLWR